MSPTGDAVLKKSGRPHPESAEIDVPSCVRLYRQAGRASTGNCWNIMNTQLSTEDSDHPGEADGLVMNYHRLRERLLALNSAPVRDMAAIDEVMHQLDETHAAFKARHSSGIDHQRY